MKIHLLISFIAMFFMLSGTLVLSAEWDNVNVYDEKTETANISNSFLWIFPTSQIASAKLNTPHTVFVMAGRDRLVGEFELNMFDDYKNFFTDMEVYDTKTGQQLSRRLDYKIKRITYVPTYGNVCKDTGKFLKNGTAIQECTWEVNGQAEVINWTKIDTKDVLKGNITIGVFARYVYPGDSIEWVPRLGNVRIAQWAVFNETFTDGLRLAYNCSSAVESRFGQYNMTTLSGSPAFNLTGSKINESCQLPSGSALQLADGVPNIELTNAERNTTWNLWVKFEKMADNQFLFRKYNGGGIGYYVATGSAGTLANAYFGGSCDWGAGSLTAGTWAMITYKSNDSGIDTYLNGEYKSHCSGGISATTAVLSIGSDSGTGYMNGSIDEFYVWNRSLSVNEIFGLYSLELHYSAGGGTPPGDPPDTTAPTVTLVSPANRTLTTNKTVSLNMTVTDDVNVSKIGFFLWNETELINQTNYTTSGTSAYSYNLSVILPHFGYFKWNYQAWDNATANNTAFGATNRTVIYYNTSAIWNNAALEIGLVAHYSFEETSGNLTDKVKGRYNHSISGHVGQTYPGIYGNAYYFNKSDPQLWTEYNMTGDINDLENVGGVSVNVWYNSGGFPSGASSTDQTQRVNIFTFGNGTDGNGFLNIGTYVNLPNQICIMTGGQASPPSDEQLACDQAKTNDNYWHMVTATINVTGAHLYVDGVFRNRSSKDFISEIFHGIDRMCFSRFCRLGNDLSDYRLWNGSIDEAGIWNRSLTSAEVLSLYNYGGSGNFTLTTESLDNTPPTVVLISPENGTTVLNLTVSFNVTATDDINVSMLGFYIWNSSGIVNQTNISTSGIGVGLNLTYVLPRDDVYLWNFLGYDNNSNKAWSTTSGNRSLTGYTTLLWNSTLEDGVVLYYNGSSSVESYRGIYNLTTDQGVAAYNTTGALVDQTIQLPVGTSVNISDSPYFELTNAQGDTTINLWMKTNVSGLNTILHKYDGGGTGWFMYVNSTGSLNLMYMSSGNCDWSAGSIVRDTWTMITLAKNTSGITTYKNGVYKTHCNGTILSSTSPLIVGRDSADNYINGSVDEIGVWNKTLIANNLLHLYNVGYGLHYLPSAPDAVSYYHNASSMVVFEGESVKFSLSLTSTNFTDKIGYGYLVFNNTRYSPDSLVNTSTQYNLSRNITIPIGYNGTYQFFWNYSMLGVFANYSTDSKNITVNQFSMDDCRVNTNKLINISFKNETLAQEPIKALITSTWVYYTNNLSLNKTYTYNNVTEQWSYPFCFSNTSSTIHVIPNAQYDNAESEVRTYSPGTLTLTNTTSNISLLLLPTSAGILVTFQVINLAEQPLSGATIVLTKDGTTVGSATTGGAGTATIFLDPATAYTLTVSRSGYETFSTSSTFASGEYTIQLSSTNTTTYTDSTRGITTAIKPSLFSLYNDTSYSFNFTISSTYWILEEFGFYLKNGSGTVLAFISGTNETGGFLSVINNTDNHSSIILEAYYKSNGTYNNISRLWMVINTDGTGFSIANLVTNFSSAVGSGLFGMTPLALSVISFVFIFVGTGYLGKRFGGASLATLTGFAATLTIFLDVSGLLPQILPDSFQAVGHFPALFMSVIALIFIVREVQNG